MPDNAIKAVVFDLGETLLTFGKVKPTEFFRQGAMLSYDFLKKHGQPVGNFNPYLWRNLFWLRISFFISGLTGRDIDSFELLKKLALQRGADMDKQQWEHLAWLWYEPLSKQAKIETDICSTLATLKQKGLKLGIISNTFINSISIEKHLQQLGILDFFQVRLYSYKFRFRKPDVRIFRIAAQQLSEETKNILFVGDRIDKDIIPALKAGMQAVLKTAYTNAAKNMPSGVRKINSLSELPELIASIGKNIGT